jgi:hypothetical protein
MKTLLFWLSNFLPARIINDGEHDYLERYYVGTLFGVRFYLHRFIGSDPDRGLHDHPWRWAFSLILSGYYYEQTRYGLTKKRLFNFLTGDSFHRVILPRKSEIRAQDSYGVHLALVEPADALPCWTLFCHRAARVKTWGFLRGTTYLPHPSADQGWWKTAPKGRQLRAQQAEAAALTGTE